MSKGAPPRRIRTQDPMIISSTLSPLSQRSELSNRWKIFAIYALTLYTVASPDPDPNPRGGDQLCNPNECNSTLTSGTRGIYPYPYIYIYVDERGHCLRLGSPLTFFPRATVSANSR